MLDLNEKKGAKHSRRVILDQKIKSLLEKPSRTACENNFVFVFKRLGYMNDRIEDLSKSVKIIEQQLPEVKEQTANIPKILSVTHHLSQ